LVGWSVGRLVAVVEHSCELQACDSGEAGHSSPPNVASDVVLKVLVCVPPPHSSEHELHELQDPAQFSGHGWSLQTCVRGDGHSSPPSAGGTETLKAADCVPPPHPHGLEQAPHSCQEPSQSTGQLWALQACESGDVGQAMPSWACCIITVKIRDRVPPPHSKEHGPHSCQDPVQSTGQARELQDCESGEAGQSSPPNEAWVVMLKVRTCVPPPHEFEQGPQALKDP